MEAVQNCNSRDISCTNYYLKQTSLQMLRVSNCQTSLGDFILSLIHHIYTYVGQVVLNMGQNRYFWKQNGALNQIRVSGCDRGLGLVFPDPYTTQVLPCWRRIHLENFITILPQLVLLWNVSLPVFTLILDFKNIKEVWEPLSFSGGPKPSSSDSMKSAL